MSYAQNFPNRAKRVRILGVIGCVSSRALRCWVRLVIREIGRLMWIDDHLRELSDNHQPCDGSRCGGYPNDEIMPAEWTGTMGKLLIDGDTLLHGDSYKIGSDNPHIRCHTTT